MGRGARRSGWLRRRAVSRRGRMSRRTNLPGLTSRRMNLPGPTSRRMSLRGPTSQPTNPRELTSQLTSRQVIRPTEAMDRTPRTAEMAGTEVMGMAEMEVMAGTTDPAAASPSQRISPPSRTPAGGFFPSGLTGCKRCFAVERCCVETVNGLRQERAWGVSLFCQYCFELNARDCYTACLVRLTSQSWCHSAPMLQIPVDPG